MRKLSEDPEYWFQIMNANRPNRNFITSVPGLAELMDASQEAEKILDSFGPAPHEFLSEEEYMRGEFESYIDRQKSKGRSIIHAPKSHLNFFLSRKTLAFGYFQDNRNQSSPKAIVQCVNYAKH